MFWRTISSIFVLPLKPHEQQDSRLHFTVVRPLQLDQCHSMPYPCAS
jgi:hypothetical protein